MPRKKYKAQNQFSKIAGGLVSQGIDMIISRFGDYKINSNSKMKIGMSVPTFANNDGRFLFTHKEYLGDITSTIAFTTTRYSINPGINESFPWLSQIAMGFEQYKVHGLVFYFRSMSGTNVLAAGANSALGTVIMSTQYDPKDAPFASKFEMENYEFANSVVPYKDLLHPVECKRSLTMMNELLVRGQEQPVDSDISFYDFGVFNISTMGMQADGGSIGELWVTYDIEFLKPKISNHPSTAAKGDAWQITGAAAATPFGTSRTQVESSLGGTLTSTSYSLPVNAELGSQYVIHWHATGNSTANVLPTITLTNCAYVILYGSGSVHNGSTTAVTLIWDAIVTPTALGAVISFGVAGTLPASVTQSIFSSFLIPRVDDYIDADNVENSRLQNLEHLMEVMWRERTFKPDKIGIDRQETDHFAKLQKKT